MKPISSFTLVAISLTCLGQLLGWTTAQNINYFGVAFSPYVRYGNPPWDSYSLEEIKQMLNIILTYHNSVSTYGMGVDTYNMNKPWDKADSNCLIARAAAQINRDRRAVVLSVAQGINQRNDGNVQQREIDNAFQAAQEANGIRSGTVWGLVFTNEYIQDANPGAGQKVLDMIRNNRNRARQQNMRVGTRIHICGQIWGGPYRDILVEIAKNSDFIMCNLYPVNTNNVDGAVKAISDAYYSARDGFRQYNPNIEVIIGETGWASEGDTGFNPAQNNNIQNMNNFWNKMRNWATTNRVKVQMFEAFDEDWKDGPRGEKHLGWWRRAQDNSNRYTEKATGKQFS